jgi:hypothetical protein
VLIEDNAASEKGGVFQAFLAIFIQLVADPDGASILCRNGWETGRAASAADTNMTGRPARTMTGRRASFGSPCKLGEESQWSWALSREHGRAGALELRSIFQKCGVAGSAVEVKTRSLITSAAYLLGIVSRLLAIGGVSNTCQVRSGGRPAPMGWTVVALRPGRERRGLVTEERWRQPDCDSVVNLQYRCQGQTPRLLQKCPLLLRDFAYPI